MAEKVKHKISVEQEQKWSKCTEEGQIRGCVYQELHERLPHQLPRLAIRIDDVQKTIKGEEQDQF